MPIPKFTYIPLSNSLTALLTIYYRIPSICYSYELYNVNFSIRFYSFLVLNTLFTYIPGKSIDSGSKVDTNSSHSTIVIFPAVPMS